HMIKRNHTIGLKHVQYIDTGRIFNDKPRVLGVSVWYPADPLAQTHEVEQDIIWKMQDVAKDTPIFSQCKKLPLILFSHGYTGSPYGTSWFAEYLACHGYIVASVKHYGNSWDSIIPEIGVRPWNRPQDLSFVL